MDLCDSCKYCTKAAGFGREAKECGIFTKNINFPVEKCDSYVLKGSLSLQSMEYMAIYIEKKKDGPGFKFTKHDNNIPVTDYGI